MRRLLFTLLLLLGLTGVLFASLFSDDFNRANSADLGASWDSGYTGKDNLNIVSNRLRATQIDVAAVESTNATIGRDHRARVTIPTFTGVAFNVAVVMVRTAAPATQTAYACNAFRNDVGGITSVISELTAGAEANLSTESATTWGSGDAIICEVAASAIRMFRVPSGGSAALLLSATDSSITSGRGGLAIYTTGVVSDTELDDFLLTDLSGTRMTLLGVGR